MNPSFIGVACREVDEKRVTDCGLFGCCRQNE